MLNYSVAELRIIKYLKNVKNKFKIFNYLSFHNDFIDKLYTIFI